MNIVMGLIEYIIEEIRIKFPTMAGGTETLLMHMQLLNLKALAKHLYNICVAVMMVIWQIVE